MKKKILLILTIICLSVTSLFSVLSVGAENTADYNDKLKLAYDPWNNTEVLELTEKGLYIESSNTKAGFNFKDRQFKEKAFSLSFINPIYDENDQVIDSDYYRTSVQITLKDGNNQLRFNFSDSGKDQPSKLEVLLLKGNDNYKFNIEILGSMTENYEYQVIFDYNSQDMIKSRVVNSVATDIFKTGKYDMSSFKANVGGQSVGVDGDTLRDKVENFKKIIKDTFKDTIYFEPYVQLWGDLGGETKRKIYVTEHNGQRFDNGAEYLVTPYVTNIVQYMTVEENSVAKMAFTGSTEYLKNPTKFETDTPGYKVHFYAMIYREPVYNDNIKNIKVTLINGEDKTVVHNGGGWNVNNIPVGNAGIYQLEVTITSNSGKTFTKSFDFEVVKKDRIELSNNLSTYYKQGEDILLPTANLVENSVIGEVITPSVTLNDNSVTSSNGVINSAESGNYKVVWESGSIKLEKTFTVIAKNKQLIGLQINKPPTKLVYEVGESFDMTGLMIQKKYLDGSLEEIWGGFSLVTDKPLKITDSGAVVILTDEYGVNGYLTVAINVIVPEVKELLVSSVVIKKAPKLCYIVGESVDLTGIEIKVTFNDNTEKLVTDGFTLNINEALALTDEKVTVSFSVDGFDLTCDIPIIVDEVPTEKSGCNSTIETLIILSSLTLISSVLVIKKFRKA